MLYERGSGELWYYGEKGNFVEFYFSRTCVRQGFVLGAFLFCLAMYPVYARLQDLLGSKGKLYAYSDDVYLISNSVSMAKAPASEQEIYKKVGIRIGWGLGKTHCSLFAGLFMNNLVNILQNMCS